MSFPPIWLKGVGDWLDRLQQRFRPSAFVVGVLKRYGDDRAGMLKELTAVISDDNTNIRTVDISRTEDGEAEIAFVVEAEDLRHLNRMVLGIRRVPGVRAVQRTTKL